MYRNAAPLFSSAAAKIAASEARDPGAVHGCPQDQNFGVELPPSITILKKELPSLPPTAPPPPRLNLILGNPKGPEKGTVIDSES